MAKAAKAAKVLLGLLRELVGDSGDAVLQASLSEVQQQAQAVIGDAEVGEELFLVRRRQTLEGFQLHEDQVIDEEIGAEAHIEAHVFVAQRDRHLALDTKTALAELVSQHHLVNGL